MAFVCSAKAGVPHVTFVCPSGPLVSLTLWPWVALLGRRQFLAFGGFPLGTLVDVIPLAVGMGRCMPDSRSSGSPVVPLCAHLGLGFAVVVARVSGL